MNDYQAKISSTLLHQALNGMWKLVMECGEPQIFWWGSLGEIRTYIEHNLGASMQLSEVFTLHSNFHTA